MARSGKYPKKACSHCGKLVSAWGPVLARHAKFCKGAGEYQRGDADVIRLIEEIRRVASRA